MNHLPVQYLIGGTEKLSDAAWTKRSICKTMCWSNH